MTEGEISIIDAESERSLDSMAKKDDDMIPTDANYQDEPKIEKKSSNFVPISSSRPTFSIFGAEEANDDIDADLALLTKKTPVSNQDGILSQKKELSSQEAKWLDCQSSFLNYMGKIRGLMNNPC